MANQGQRVQSIIDHYGLTNTNTHNGYYMQMFDLESIPAGKYSERMLGWLLSKFDPADYPVEDLNDLQQKYADFLGFDDWDSVNNLFPATSPEYFFQNGIDFDFQDLGEYNFN